MPFKSEKQRRYLWANEPEIARDWTDTYGSRIQKNSGGISQLVKPGPGRPGYSGVLDRNIANLEAALAYSDLTPEQRAQAEKDLQKAKEAKGTWKDKALAGDPVEEPEVLEPDFTKVNKMSMIPDNFIEQIKSLWEGEPPTPEGIMKAGGYPFMDPVDANYIPRDPMLAEYAPSDDYENIARFTETETEDEDEGGNWFNTIRNWAGPIYNTYKGNLLGMAAGIPGLALSMFGGGNRGPVINPSTQRFMQNYNVGVNPQTGRMMGGPFAGQNLPGTSMFGSKTPQEMAQKWLAKYGDKKYKTPKQKQKQQQITNIATMNQAPPGQNGGVNGGTGTGGGGGVPAAAQSLGYVGSYDADWT